MIQTRKILNLLLCTLGATSSLGCSTALFSLTSFRSEHAFEDEALLRLADELESNRGVSKARVIEILGPPVTVIGQPDGDVFVYRRTATDSSSIHVSAASLVIAAPSVPVFHSQSISGREDVLMIWMDETGKVRGKGFHFGVDDASYSTAAALGESFQGVID